MRRCPHQFRTCTGDLWHHERARVCGRLDYCQPCLRPHTQPVQPPLHSGWLLGRLGLSGRLIHVPPRGDGGHGWEHPRAGELQSELWLRPQPQPLPGAARLIQLIIEQPCLPPAMHAWETNWTAARLNEFNLNVCFVSMMTIALLLRAERWQPWDELYERSAGCERTKRR